MVKQSFISQLACITLCAILLTGCQPSDSRPGLWLRGEHAKVIPDDWRFTDAHPEIFVQVKTPYLLPHSVTIWCAEVGGDLFIAARNPESKNWVGWMENEPEITLKIADFLYPASVDHVTDEGLINDIKAKYASKYNLSPTPGKAPPPMRYWRVNANI